MNLYERDYTEINNDEEQEALKEYNEHNKKIDITFITEDLRFSHPNLECRRFLLQHTSLFPNNFLDSIFPFNSGLDKPDFLLESEKYKELIYNNGKEIEIQKYIKTNRKWFIPGSIFRDYNFGNHDAYLFPEQMLGAEYRVDYLLLGKNSDGFSMVLVEFETADTPFLLGTTDTESASVRKGLTQIKNWKRWLENNRNYLFESMGFKDKSIDIPIFRTYYCLVVSRRDYMDKRALDVRSQLCYEMNNTKIITFDRLSDNIKHLYHDGLLLLNKQDPTL